jgi:hypothetical protein
MLNTKCDSIIFVLKCLTNDRIIMNKYFITIRTPHINDYSELKK